MASESQSTGTFSTDSSCVCFRCNRTGRCRNCACCKQGRLCVNCLPSRLERCENVDATFDSSLSSVYSDDDSPSNQVGVTATPDVQSLPCYELLRAPNFVWGDIPGDSFVNSVSCCYDEVVHSRKHLFYLPSG